MDPTIENAKTRKGENAKKGERDGTKGKGDREIGR
jgi:hypothetical protein